MFTLLSPLTCNINSFLHLNLPDAHPHSCSESIQCTFFIDGGYNDGFASFIPLDISK